MLLDEPFSNLDTELRERLSLELREILKAANTTAIRSSASLIDDGLSSRVVHANTG
jgi:ABC-type Fe3+/spermidine/putrescine transport system ATPase subunit